MAVQVGVALMLAVPTPGEGPWCRPSTEVSPRMTQGGLSPPKSPAAGSVWSRHANSASFTGKLTNVCVTQNEKGSNKGNYSWMHVITICKDKLEETEKR